MTIISNRYEFVYLFDVANGNPNGDPDGGNRPRTDPQTEQGLVTDVCLKRKVRNYVEMAKDGANGFAMYVTEGAILNDKHAAAHKAVGSDPKGKGEKNKKEGAREQMCKTYYDVRTFGAMMATEIDAGTARGPVQLSFARSIDPIVPLDISITRMAATKAAEGKDNKTMGGKWIVPYGLYRAHGYISAPLAERTGFSDDDLSMLWQALGGMFEHDRSATRGEMAPQALVVFKHASKLGNAPAHKLFERVKIKRAGDMDKPPRNVADYAITVDDGGLPEGVTVEQRI